MAVFDKPDSDIFPFEPGGAPSRKLLFHLFPLKKTWLPTANSAAIIVVVVVEEHGEMMA